MANPADIPDSIAMLQAMYPQDNELVLSSETARYARKPTSAPPENIDMTLSVPLDRFPDHELEVHIVISSETGITRMTPRHPDWLDRRSCSTLAASLDAHSPNTPISEYILDTIEILRSRADELLWVRSAAELEAEENMDDDEDDKPDRLERVWFWFPMLSTREKRKDMVDYAPRYGLTGFVLAGKPALLCLEGDGDAVGQYMSDIKSISWSDIPPFQKKVTERFRRPLADESERKFTQMTDITSMIPTYGQYNHRGDMGEVRRLMEQWGVGDDFGAAVLNNSL